MNFMAFSDINISLGLIEEKQPQEYLDFLTSTLLWHTYWRAGILTVDDRVTPPALATTQHQTKKLSTLEVQNYTTNLNHAQ